MWDVTLTTKKWPLDNCTIPAFTMSLDTQYIVQMIATSSLDASLTASKDVFVQPSSPPVQVALI
jgi:hypothetical protein